jgi:putative tricarboxylic transport membrane protein
VSVFHDLLQGFVVAATPANLLAAFVGVVVGTVVGVLPGIGALGAMALLLPFTFTLDVRGGLIMLAGIWYGAMYGGSTTSILVNLPGEASSVVTTLDGYQMARKGRAGAALAVAAIGSFVAGTLGLVGLTLFAPALANAALAFSRPELLAVSVLGLVLLSRLTGGSAIASLLMIFAGMALATVGMDFMSGINRFTFGVLQLSTGIELAPLVMGLFGLAEVLTVVSRPYAAETARVRWRQLYPSAAELRRSVKPIARGSVLGFLVGIIPGPAAVMASFVSYAIERRLSGHPEEFGKGAIEGVAGPESANNAATAGAMIPLLTLGLPFAPPTAILLGGFMVHGIAPGPLLMVQHPDVFWGLLASMYIGNIMLLILNLPLVPAFAGIIRTPPRILMPIIVVVSVVGAYSINNRLFDVWVMLAAGALGYLLRKADLPAAPLVVGYVLGPLIEVYARQSLMMLHGNPWAIFMRPLATACLALTAAVALGPPVVRTVRAAMQKRARHGAHSVKNSDMVK